MKLAFWIYVCWVLHSGDREISQVQGCSTITNYQEKHPYSAIYDYYLSQNRNIAEIFAEEGEIFFQVGPILEAFRDLDLNIWTRFSVYSTRDA